MPAQVAVPLPLFNDMFAGAAANRSGGRAPHWHTVLTQQVPALLVRPIFNCLDCPSTGGPCAPGQAQVVHRYPC